MASSGWLAICPKRPKPMIRMRPDSPSACSTPSIDCSAVLGSTKRRPMMKNGVSAIETITVAVKIALVGPSIMPAVAAVV
ncbi:hypothetical protein D3C87_2016370 [compost metagenome]